MSGPQLLWGGGRHLLERRETEQKGEERMEEWQTALFHEHVLDLNLAKCLKIKIVLGSGLDYSGILFLLCWLWWISPICNSYSNADE